MGEWEVSWSWGSGLLLPAWVRLEAGESTFEEELEQSLALYRTNRYGKLTSYSSFAILLSYDRGGARRR